MTVCRTRVPWRFSFNFVLAIFVLLVIALTELGITPSQHLGFYCNDPRLSHCYSGETVTSFVLIGVTIILPVVVMWLTEWSFYTPDSYKSLDCTTSSTRVRQFWLWYGYYTIGWCYMIFVVEVLKVTVGEPRPHFFDSCLPKENYNCTSEKYFTSYTCTNKRISSIALKDSDRSFPSGHSAASIFTAVYLVWYLQHRLPDRFALLLIKPWLQCLVVIWGLGCSMSRITDHRHHWWDVLVGALIGITFGYFVVKIPCRCFKSGNNVDASSAIDLRTTTSTTLHADVMQPVNVGCTTGKRSSSSNNNNNTSVKKLLSYQGSENEATEDRELGDMNGNWSA